jgi:ribosomal protein L12E/L44/L45/RPP1/RPP2|tara:strand:- start:259 stop:465 length:207 start_codon:yes stop_codon:yes gene_type:complete
MPKKKQKSIWIEITQEEIKDIVQTVNMNYAGDFFSDRVHEIVAPKIKEAIREHNNKASNLPKKGGSKN